MIAGKMRYWALAAAVLLGGVDLSLAQGERPGGNRLFVSGHSLTSQPMPDYLATILKAMGEPVTWEEDNVPGSSIKRRLCGEEGAQVADLICRDWGAPAGFDLAIVTEQHAVLDTMIWNDTPDYLREFQDKFIAANPGARTYFFMPWLGVSDMARPAAWASYERAAAPVWRCMVQQMNAALASQGRGDAMTVIPASLALAQLVERAADDAFQRAFGSSDLPAALFSDDVHLSPYGNYFIALVSAATLSQRSVVGAWSPDLMNAELDLLLQELASDIALSFKAQGGVTARDCRVPRAFIWDYAAYMEQTYDRPQRGWIRARLRRVWNLVKYWLTF